MSAPRSPAHDDVPAWRRRVIHCSACGKPGHRKDGCPNLSPSDTADPDHIDDIAAVATLREARDAIAADIVWHEKIRARIEERLAEAYEHRAKLDVEIRRLRVGAP